MMEVLLFHHAQGLTPGIRAFADDLHAGGHIVHISDLFGGRTFPSIEEGLAYIEKIGFDDLRKCGVRIANCLPFDLVYAGFSFGVLPAQQLAQTRAKARGALLFQSCLPISGVAILRCKSDQTSHWSGARISEPCLEQFRFNPGHNRRPRNGAGIPRQ